MLQYNNFCCLYDEKIQIRWEQGQALASFTSGETELHDLPSLCTTSASWPGESAREKSLYPLIGIGTPCSALGCGPCTVWSQPGQPSRGQRFILGVPGALKLQPWIFCLLCQNFSPHLATVFQCSLSGGKVPCEVKHMSLQSTAHPVYAWREAFAAAQVVAGFQLSMAWSIILLSLTSASTLGTGACLYFSCRAVLCLGKG